GDGRIPASRKRDQERAARRDRAVRGRAPGGAGGLGARGEGRHRARLRPDGHHGQRDARDHQLGNGRIGDRAGAEPGRRQHRRGDPGRLDAASRGRPGTPHGPRARHPRGPRVPGPRGEPAGRAHRRQGPHPRRHPPPGRHRGPRHRAAEARGRAHADGRQGHRRADPHRARPARADHRRPRHGQDGHRHRHHHQPEGPGRRLRVRRHRPEGLDGGGRGQPPVERRRHGLHHRRRGDGVGPGPHAVHRAVRGHRAGRVLHVHQERRGQGHAHPLRVRRPFQAGRGLPADVAGAAPPPGARGVPGRRVLPALAPPRARGQAVGRDGRRVADRASHHRDAGRRRVGVHPDQRDLHHGRAD
ncbi:MAG: ATP synthase alpha chain, partial [uncultured Gemmatimonadetes bacterium]